MSPRAACRLEDLGFEHVFDYTLGIADWKAAGLSLGGDVSEEQTAAAATRPDIPTASTDELLGPVWERVQESGWDEAIVISCDDIVIGRIRGRTWDEPADSLIGAVMESGPTTVRPTTTLGPLVGSMEKKGTKLVTVTTPQGVLVGVLLLEDAQQVLKGESPERIWADCDGCPGRWTPSA